MHSLHTFLLNNRTDLIGRCAAKVAARPLRGASAEQLRTGVPLFLDQLIRTLQAEEAGEQQSSIRISGASGGDAQALSEMGVSAAAHGKELLKLGFTVDQVVHDYGDLCQAITDLAFERDAPFTVDEFRTLNRCLDNAIADAVTEFSLQRDTVRDLQRVDEANERLGILVNEVRNALGTVSIAFTALETGGLPISGATGTVLKRSLKEVSLLVDRSLEEVRSKSQAVGRDRVFSLADFITEAKLPAQLQAAAKNCLFTADDVDSQLGIRGNYELLSAALANLANRCSSGSAS